MISARLSSVAPVFPLFAVLSVGPGEAISSRGLHTIYNLVSDNGFEESPYETDITYTNIPANTTPRMTRVMSPWRIQLLGMEVGIMLSTSTVDRL